ncbi:putative band 4.1-like protein 4A isoform X1 [Apostichopus japonicus]|uniref:Putative band 4.1-like protein 4A isoform X1 n=1 Tax=Stichopus japonicus TaxID=307972 RepID=A0A2G8JUX6_STIJA|nr:putative band 4.1-like protein 4A isoform X1 [Apostichopus japonicus]
MISQGRNRGYFSYLGYAKGIDLLQKVFDQLNLVETDCFGLRYKDKDNAAQWLDTNKSLRKQIKNVSYLTMYFGVKFYLEDPCQLKEEITRYQFFLQIKQDLLVGRIPCNTNMAAVLASLCLQSELGDFDSSLHTDGYISEFRFIPDQSEDFEQHVGELHQSLRPKISRVHFEETKFVLAVQRRSGGDNEYSFQLESNEACRQLWTCCVEQHAFFRLPSFHSTSFRHSGRTKKEALELSSSLRRKQPKVERTQSKRFSRRFSSGSESEAVIFRETQSVSREDALVRYGRESPTSAVSTRSLPWADVSRSEGGLYSPSEDLYDSYRSKKRKPQSRASSPGNSRRRYHSDRSGDESETGFARRYRRNVSLTELTDNNKDVVRRRRRRKSRGGDTSGSEAETDYSKRKSHSRRIEDLEASLVFKENIKKGLVDTRGLTPNQLQDISYINVIVENGVAVQMSPNKRYLRRRSSYESRRHSQSGLSEQGLLAMQELQQELVKLGQPTVNRKEPPQRHKLEEDQDIPVNVLSNKRMSLTTQEILRVSKSFGDHRDMLTEL